MTKHQGRDKDATSARRRTGARNAANRNANPQEGGGREQVPSMTNLESAQPNPSMGNSNLPQQTFGSVTGGVGSHQYGNYSYYGGNINDSGHAYSLEEQPVGCPDLTWSYNSPSLGQNVLPPLPAGGGFPAASPVIPAVAYQDANSTNPNTHTPNTNSVNQNTFARAVLPYHPAPNFPTASPTNLTPVHQDVNPFNPNTPNTDSFSHKNFANEAHAAPYQQNFANDGHAAAVAPQQYNLPVPPIRQPRLPIAPAGPRVCKGRRQNGIQRPCISNPPNRVWKSRGNVRQCHDCLANKPSQSARRCMAALEAAGLEPCSNCYRKQARADGGLCEACFVDKRNNANLRKNGQGKGRKGNKGAGSPGGGPPKGNGGGGSDGSGPASGAGAVGVVLSGIDQMAY
ncbi:hypothetical protein QR685DRAFT_560107 [Neurospora intermedia]|uniref:GATA-type domain-containing protein n=1 Tax=Neurospora intermedia TaxID=5142 RepID=A0ABR3DM12_NEUIN